MVGGLFQSLIGFKINWNNKRKRHERGIGTFQSLIGFKINWNFKALQAEANKQWEVSIPNRV